MRAAQMEAKAAKEKERAEREKIMAEEKAAEEGIFALIKKSPTECIFSTHQGRNGRRKNESTQLA